MGSDLTAGMTERKLVRGWNCPSPGVTIRLAVPADLGAVAELVPATGHALGPGVTDAISRGVIGTAHRAGLAARGGEYGQVAFTRAIAQEMVEHGLEGVYAAAGVVLVAEHRDRGIVGTVVAFPPAHVSQQFVARAERSGADQREAGKLALSGAVALAKIRPRSMPWLSRNRRGAVVSVPRCSVEPRRSTSPTGTSTSTARSRPTGQS